MGTLDCFLIIQREVPQHPTIQETATISNQISPNLFSESGGETANVSGIGHNESLLEKIFRLSSPESDMSGEFFRGYIYALLQQELSGNSMSG